MKRFTRMALFCLFAGSLFSTAGQGQEAPPPAGRALETAAESSDAPGETMPVSRLYRLSANDVVHVRVFQEDDLESRLRIAQDGTVTFPLLGTLRLGGRTVDEATDHIRELLAKDYLVNPHVSLQVVEFAQRRFTVLGQVNRPGTYQMPPDEDIDLLQAIAQAGGFTRIARRTAVTVTRQVEGQRRIIRIDARALSRDGERDPFVVLPGDTVNVDEGLF